MATDRHRPMVVGACWVLVTAAVAVLPALGLAPGPTRIVLLTAILAMIVSGLNLSWGYAGELALGQAAIYAVGAYTTAFVSTYVVNDVLVCLVAAGFLALLVGLATGVPGLRLGGWTLAMISFFLVILVPSVINAFGATLGGLSGFVGIPVPKLLGVELEPIAFFAVVVVVASLWFAFYRNLVRGRAGRALLVLQHGPEVTGSSGIWAYREKLAAYATGAVPAGLAGALFGYLDGYLAPESFSLTLAVSILAASVLGGPRSVFGAFFGAAVMELGPLQTSALQNFATIGFGVVLVLGGILFGDGVASAVRRTLPARRLRATTEHLDRPVDPEAALPEVAPQTLVVEAVGRSFGGNRALDGVSLRAEPGRITALIGPNGSGKTTLLNAICGFVPPDTGSIRLGDRELTRLQVRHIAAAGVGRTFQAPLIPKHLTVAEVIASGRYGHPRVSLPASGFRWGRYRRVVAEDRDRVERTAAGLGLTGKLHLPASTLSLGTRRMIELARVVAAGRSILLLDEVASGLDETELHKLAGAVRAARDSGCTVVLVEHNFALVTLLADTVVVLAGGRLLASGTPAEIESDAAVREHYLGAGAAVSGTGVKAIGGGAR